MTQYNDTDFMLQNDYGKKLYHESVSELPIIDPHNHIDTAALASNKKYDNVYQLWVQNDPYKHRAMRIFGIEEALITGNSKSDEDKFLAWATCFPATAGNPLFHWSCMELKTLFGIEDILDATNASQIWNQANTVLQQKDWGALDFIKNFGVEMLCTSDDLLDSLEHHLALAKQQTEVVCLPSLRADSIIAFDQPSFFSWLDKLQAITDIKIYGIESYKTAIINRLNFFDEVGCLLSDHSFDSGFVYHKNENEQVDDLFQRLLAHELLNQHEFITLQSYFLHFLGKEYAKRKWKMQLHIGAYRYTSSVLRGKVGPAGGFACIGHTADVRSVCHLLDDLDIAQSLPKTILYTLNPADNAVFASITGSYSEDGVQGKVQFGPAWWYNDHFEGITQQLLALSSYGLLSTSIGMTTDSRSILSFLRHDYFRRILCNLIGTWIAENKLPLDWNYSATMVKNISYYNIKNWIKK